MQRYYTIKDNVLYMSTRLEDDFGEIILDTIAPLDQDWFSQRVRSGSSSMNVPFSVRVGELEHFLCFFKLFNPEINNSDYGLSQIVSQTPSESEPWET